MRKLRELLRLKAAGLAGRQIGASLDIGQSTVVDYLARARRAGLAWPLPDDMTDAALEALLFPPSAHVPKDKRPLPHWPTLYAELKRPGVTLQLLWEEHRAAHPDSYGYSRFCELYRAWEGKLRLTMRQTHIAGERVFVDYAGTTIDIFDAATGEVHACQLFVAVLGASSYTYADDNAHADAARLDRLAHARVRVLRWRARNDGVGQLEVRQHQGVLLRAGREPLLRGDGEPLRHCGFAGPPEQAARQGEG